MMIEPTGVRQGVRDIRRTSKADPHQASQLPSARWPRTWLDPWLQGAREACTEASPSTVQAARLAALEGALLSVLHGARADGLHGVTIEARADEGQVFIGLSYSGSSAQGSQG
ncbi:MAG: hypothetical protein EOP82_14095 [Variovorax sp.]|nr:MAG: hypothetical protein EOP82_14095 [Variovorax sp.]